MALLAAGMSTRYGRLKQLEPVGPSGEALVDYAVFDAYRAGFRRVLLIVRKDLEKAFQDHIRDRWPGDMNVVFHYQELNDLPGQDPENPVIGDLISRRRKPWGTAHALLSARDLLPDPFIVLNADDFYGAAAFSQAITLMNRDLRLGPDDPPGFGLIAYTLGDTLSRHGGVSRGVCTVDGRGWLESVREVLQIRRSEGDIRGISLGGEDLLLSGAEPISTNFWVFTPEIFPALEEGLHTFIQDRLREEVDPGRESEFLIPTEINRMISRKEARVWVLRTNEPFFGITHPMDWEWVAGSIRDLIREGRYPEALWPAG